MDIPLRDHIDRQFTEVHRRLDEIKTEVTQESTQNRDDRRDMYERMNKAEREMESRPTYKEMLVATAAVAGLLISLFELIF